MPVAVALFFLGKTHVEPEIADYDVVQKFADGYVNVALPRGYIGAQGYTVLVGLVLQKFPLLTCVEPVVSIDQPIAVLQVNLGGLVVDSAALLYLCLEIVKIFTQFHALK